MQSPANLKRHAALLDRTATRLGLDLEEEALSGRLQFDDIAEAVLRCTACPNPRDCIHWLDREAPHEDAPPVYCRNRQLLSGLMEANA